MEDTEETEPTQEVRRPTESLTPELEDKVKQAFQVHRRDREREREKGRERKRERESGRERERDADKREIESRSIQPRP